MCGIAGYYNQEPLSENTIRAVLHSISHRGPDASKHIQAKKLNLFHTRLAIIDLDQRSNQPFYSQSRKFITVYNGEIYNFKELRALIPNFQWNTESDTEVLVELFERYGADILNKINGMFSFAIYNTEEDSLFFATDPAGEKPLYIYSDGQRLAFASEIKSFKAMCLPLIENNDFLADYLFFGYIPAPNSYYKNIYKLPAGHLSKIKLSDIKLNFEKYFKLPTEILDISYDEAKEQCQFLIAKAVKQRLISDRPIGSFLSGGLDSSIISLEATRLLKVDALKTFSVSFSQSKFAAQFDESKYANIVAEKIKSDHRVIESSEKIDDFKNIMIHFDEPYADSSAFPTARLCEYVSSQIKVALSGDGGDELFGGYDRFRAVLMAKSAGILFHPLRFVGNHQSSHPKLQKVYRFIKALSLKDLERLSQWNSFFSFDDLKKISLHSFERVQSRILDWEKEHSHLELGQKILHFNFEQYLFNDLLPKVDRMSMKYGLEVRSPFLDRNLIEFAFKLPTKYKFSSFQTKRILKDIYRPTLGADIVDRRKKGFGFPLEDLVSKPEALKMLSRNDLTLQQLANNTSKKYNLLSLALFQEKA